MRKLYLRFILLLSMLALLTLSNVTAPNTKVQAVDCAACRRACIQDYRDCVETMGEGAGCDLIAAECLSSCCPPPE
jgi:hypothetical protein